MKGVTDILATGIQSRDETFGPNTTKKIAFAPLLRGFTASFVFLFHYYVHTTLRYYSAFFVVSNITTIKWLC
jgi:hypothetical protein